MIERLFNGSIKTLARAKNSYLRARSLCRITSPLSTKEGVQNIEVYSAKDMKGLLGEWGEGTVWTEIQYLLVNCKGNVLDIACGTGPAMKSLERFKSCDLYGCDISESLIDLAVKSGIPRNKLKVCNAARMPYDDGCFDYSYCIGSLHVFTEEGIAALLKESRRVTKHKFFFQVPTSRSGKDEGWVKPRQFYYNNSADWWLNKCKAVYDRVDVLDSRWEDLRSVGKWFVCAKD